MPLTELRALGRRFRALPAVAVGHATTHRTRIAILSNYSMSFFVSALELALATRGIAADIYEAPFNHWEIELADSDAPYLAFKPDIVLLTLTSSLLAFREACSAPEQFAEQLIARMTRAQHWSRARFVMTLPEPLEEEFDHTSWAYHWRVVVTAALRTHSSVCHSIDLAPLIRRIGSQSWYSGRFLINGKFMCHPDRTAACGDYIGNAIASMVNRPVKLVITDLDNTLWGGIVGEDGWEHLALATDDVGYVHLRLQRFLLDLHAKGVLLAIVSKNNLDDAMEVFAKRSEMLLTPEHFAAMEINWESKSKNVMRILEYLQLSTTGVVVLDDSSFERGEMRTVFPDIFIPDFPDDPIDLVPQLLATGRFTISDVREEDRERQSHYKTERIRREQRETSLDLPAYYRSLNLTLTAMPISEACEERVLELIAKTNQFNLTTRRHDRTALRRMIADPSNYCYAFSLEDRYGAYGLIGVLIAFHEGDVYVIDSWVMSCRAMGRTVERAMFAHLWTHVASRGARRIVGEFIPTKKNAPVCNLYSTLGFACDDDAATRGSSARFIYTMGQPWCENEFVSLLHDGDASRAAVPV